MLPPWRELLLMPSFWIIMLCLFGPILYCMWIMGLIR